MHVCRSIAAIRDAVAGFRATGHSVGLVTTMGALHAGHMSLIAAAKRDHGRVVATVFVNPTQFGDPKDLETYPRTEAADLAMLEAAGCDAVLIPRADEIFEISVAQCSSGFRVDRERGKSVLSCKRVY